jgi:hypothetical protein
VNYLDASEDRGRESDQSSYQQSDDQDSDSESDTGQDFVGAYSRSLRQGSKVQISPKGNAVVTLFFFLFSSTWNQEAQRSTCHLCN